MKMKVLGLLLALFPAVASAQFSGGGGGGSGSGVAIGTTSGTARDAALAIAAENAAAKASNNLSDVANAATARSNIGAAPTASPNFTGVPTAPTPATSDSSTTIPTTAWVKAQGYGTGGSNAAGTEIADDPTNTLGAGTTAILHGELNLIAVTAANGAPTTGSNPTALVFGANQSTATRTANGIALQNILNIAQNNGLQLTCSGYARLEKLTTTQTQVAYSGGIRARLSNACQFVEYGTNLPVITIGDPTENNSSADTDWQGGDFEYGQSQYSNITASQSGTNLTVTAVGSGYIAIGQTLNSTGTQETITSQTSGTTGGTGVYVVSVSQTLASQSIAGFNAGAKCFMLGNIYFSQVQYIQACAGAGGNFAQPYSDVAVGNPNPNGSSGSLFFQNFLGHFILGGAISQGGFFEENIGSTGNEWDDVYCHNGGSLAGAGALSFVMNWKPANQRSDDKLIRWNFEHFNGGQINISNVVDMEIEDMHIEGFSLPFNDLFNLTGVQLSIHGLNVLDFATSANSGNIGLFNATYEYGNTITVDNVTMKWSNASEFTSSNAHIFEGTSHDYSDDSMVFKITNLVINDNGGNNAAFWSLDPVLQSINLSNMGLVQSYTYDPVEPTVDHPIINLGGGQSFTIPGAFSNTRLILGGGDTAARTITLSNARLPGGTLATQVGQLATIHWNSGTHSYADTIVNGSGGTITTIPTSNTSTTNYLYVENGTNFVATSP